MLKVYDLVFNNENPYSFWAALQTPFFKFSDPPFRKSWIRSCNIYTLYVAQKVMCNSPVGYACTASFSADIQLYGS